MPIAYGAVLARIAIRWPPYAILLSYFEYLVTQRDFMSVIEPVLALAGKMLVNQFARPGRYCTVVRYCDRQVVLLGHDPIEKL